MESTIIDKVIVLLECEYIRIKFDLELVKYAKASKKLCKHRHFTGEPILTLFHIMAIIVPACLVGV